MFLSVQRYKYLHVILSNLIHKSFYTKADSYYIYKKKLLKFLFRIRIWAILLLLFTACSQDDDYQAVSPVLLDLDQVPYPKLSDYQFFKTPLSELNPVFGVLPFEPRSILFTDYAKKNRFVWMPAGVFAYFNGSGNTLLMPTGSVLIKNFYYPRVQPENRERHIETRLMIKKSEGWIFANYVWNESQTEAYLDLAGSELTIEWIDDSQQLREVQYQIPSEAECISCHRNFQSSKDFPIGIKPQNLNFAYPYPEGTKNQLQQWIDYGYLKGPLPGNIDSVVNYEDTTAPLTLRARSYLDANCAHCHRTGGYADHYILRLEYQHNNLPENIGLCIVPEHDFMPGQEGNYFINPGDKETSVTYARMNTNDFYWRMPPFGKTLIHTEGVDLIGQWIDSMTETCN